MKRIVLACALLMGAMVSLGCSFLPAAFLLGWGTMGPVTGNIEEFSPPPASSDLETSEVMQLPSGSVMGDSNAPVTLVVFYDFACPHCQEYQPIIDQFIEEHVETGHARLEIRIFPTAGGYMTELAGRYAHCAARMQVDGFWSAFDLLLEMALTDTYDYSMVFILADELGLDEAKLETCALTEDQVQQNQLLAQAVGVYSTTSVRIRYGDSDPMVISYAGVEFNAGGVPYDILDAVVMGASGDMA